MNESLIIILHSYKLEPTTHHPPVLVVVEVVSEDLIMIDCPRAVSRMTQ